MSDQIINYREKRTGLQIESQTFRFVERDIDGQDEPVLYVAGLLSIKTKDAIALEVLREKFAPIKVRDEDGKVVETTWPSEPIKDSNALCFLYSDIKKAMDLINEDGLSIDDESRWKASKACKNVNFSVPTSVLDALHVEFGVAHNSKGRTGSNPQVLRKAIIKFLAWEDIKVEW